MRTVFLSSTAVDLSSYREAVYSAICGLEGYHCVRMEDFRARDQQALDLCRKKVQECDLFVAILGLCHGSSPPRTKRSFTELEYEAAVAADRPRLVFVTPESFPVPGDLREPEEKYRRQQELRKRVSLDRVQATFSSPEALKVEVVTAIRNWEQDSAARAVGVPAAASQGAGKRTLELGPLVCKMCDRWQEDEFKDHFAASLRRRPGAPQVYLVRGEESDCPESLVERLTRTSLGSYAALKAGEHTGVVARQRVAWPGQGELEQRRRRLIAHLFEVFAPAYELEHEDFSPAAFVRLGPVAANPVIALEHEIRPAQGEDIAMTLDLLTRYLRFWDEVAACRPQALIVAFLWVLYPPAEAGRPRRRDFDREAFEKALAEIHRRREKRAGMSPFFPLSELSCVQKDHVLAWFSRYCDVYDTKTRLEKCRELFGARDCIPMADVEHELGKIQQSAVLHRRDR